MSSKKRPLDAVDQLHIKELDEFAKQQSEKNAIWMKELEIEKQRNKAKVEKMRLDAQRHEQQMDLMRMFFTQVIAPGHGGNSNSCASEASGDSLMASMMASSSLPGLTHNVIGSSALQTEPDPGFDWSHFGPTALNGSFGSSEHSSSVDGAEGL